jgi:hypothetical protein
LNTDPTFSRFNFRHTNGSYALSVTLSTGAGITYSIWTTLENIDANGIPFKNQLDRFFILAEIEDRADGVLYQDNNLTNHLLLQVTESTAPTTDSLEFIYMQS